MRAPKRRRLDPADDRLRRLRPAHHTGMEFGGNAMSTINDLDDFKALDPFFRIIEKGLDGLADGEHFFDLLAEDVIFDYIITAPGYPRHVEGRQSVAELYRPYGETFVLDRCHDLAVHHDSSTGVV